MRYGFTGSSTETSTAQRVAFTGWVSAHSRDIDEFDHGDCVKADEFAHAVIREFTNAKIIVHPPTSGRKRAWCNGDVTWFPKPYLARNKDVVDSGEVLLAMPHGEEEQRSGTWSTIRYARKRGKPVVIFWPDGAITSSPIATDRAA
jgi:hypothetical protein